MFVFIPIVSNIILWPLVLLGYIGIFFEKYELIILIIMLIFTFIVFTYIFNEQLSIRHQEQQKIIKQYDRIKTDGELLQKIAKQSIENPTQLEQELKMIDSFIQDYHSSSFRNACNDFDAHDSEHKMCIYKNSEWEYIIYSSIEYQYKFYQEIYIPYYSQNCNIDKLQQDINNLVNRVKKYKYKDCTPSEKWNKIQSLFNHTGYPCVRVNANGFETWIDITIPNIWKTYHVSLN